MKKNISINLFGTLYAIDEDAYNLLERYLDSMKSYFSRQEGGEEIADDIEHRVAELLWAEKEKGNEAVNIDMIKDIISKIGDPAQIDGENGNASSSTEQSVNNDGPIPDSHPFADGGNGSGYGEGNRDSIFNNMRQAIKERRLYRDGSNKMLGGVCSGMARYSGGDVTFWRLGTVVAALVLWWCSDIWWVPGLLGWVVPLAYLVLCFVVPVARTPEDNLRMKGEEVNPQSINEEILRETNTYQQNMYSQPAHSNGSGCLKALVIVGAVIILFPFLMATLGMLFALPVFSGLFSSGLMSHLFSDPVNGQFFSTMFGSMQGMFWALLLCMLALTIIPLAFIIRAIRGKKTSGTSILCWALVWLIALITGIFFVSKAIGEMGDAAMGGKHYEWRWSVGPFSYYSSSSTTDIADTVAVDTVAYCIDATEDLSSDTATYVVKSTPASVVKVDSANSRRSFEKVNPATLRKFEQRGMPKNQVQRLKKIGVSRRELRMLKRKYGVS